MRNGARRTLTAEWRDDALGDPLAAVTAEIANLGANMLAGAISEPVTKLLVERKADEQRLEAQVQLQPRVETITLLPLADLTAIFAQKAQNLTETLNKDKIRGEAAEIPPRLIESVTICSCGDG